MSSANFLPNGAEYIEEKIRIAVENDCRTATISGCWEISRAVRLPSNFTLILENCHLLQAEGSFDNIFVNEHHDTDIGKTMEGRDYNINIIGRGKAILDGGIYNGLSEQTQLKNGLPSVWKNNQILFTNVEGFKISGLTCHNQRYWAMNFVFCANGYIGNIDFKSNDIRIDEKGEVHHGLLQNEYAQTLVRTADGIDLRLGCHHILIENITGFVEDDTVALTALAGKKEMQYATTQLPIEISHIQVRNVRTASYCSNVRLLNQGGTILHDIVVDGVYDTSADCPYMDVGAWGVRVGDLRMYGDRHATEDETYNITVKNIYSRASNYAVLLAGAIKNLTLYGVECAEGTKMLLDARKK